jgi:hypothetical protein
VPSAADAELCAEAVRLNTRYVNEVVLGWGLCPWAERAFLDGQVRQKASLDETPVPQTVLSFIDEIDGAGIAIGLLIFPRATLRAPAFDAFAERVRRADHARRPGGLNEPPAPPYLIAAFHPTAAEAAGAGATQTFSTPPQLVSFLRRTPDPTLQLVRTSVLTRATAGGRDVSGDVTRQNFETIGARGVAVLEAVLGDIRRDRDQNYARLGRT